MKRKPRDIKDGPFDPNAKEFSSVFSEIPWQDYVDRMFFTGKLHKGAVTSSRSITIEASELRLAEMICENHKKSYQTISDVIRDSIRKGIQINYEILVKRKKEIKHRADATYVEIAYADRQLAILAHVDMVEKRIELIKERAKKNIAGHGEAWAKVAIDDLIDVADSDYPNENIRQYFEQKFAKPDSAEHFIFNLEEEREKRGGRRG